MPLVSYYPSLSGYCSCSPPQDLETIKSLSTSLIIYQKKLYKSLSLFNVYFWHSSGFMISDDGYCCLESTPVITQQSHWPCCCPKSLTQSWPCHVALMTLPLAYNQALISLSVPFAPPLSPVLQCSLQRLQSPVWFLSTVCAQSFNLSSCICASKLNDSTAVASVSTSLILDLPLIHKNRIVRCKPPTALWEAHPQCKLQNCASKWCWETFQFNSKENCVRVPW